MNANLLATVLSLSILSTHSLAAVNATTSTKQSLPTTKKININQASAEVLSKSFKGIGEKRAVNIVNYRKDNGNFKKVADLSSVKGIGKAFVDKYIVQLQNVFSVE
ncbi:MAG: helix-hairpin-helix domain-containing protein [Legionellaceae bacterium]|nr:helix-hairpin-helix domain-containing protein [Legionellaceae bacterium]